MSGKRPVWQQGSHGPLPLALYHAGRMSSAIDRLAAAMVGTRYKHSSPEPEQAGAALADLLTAKRDYDRAILREHDSRLARTKEGGDR